MKGKPVDESSDSPLLVPLTGKPVTADWLTAASTWITAHAVIGNVAGMGKFPAGKSLRNLSVWPSAESNMFTASIRAVSRSAKGQVFVIYSTASGPLAALRDVCQRAMDPDCVWKVQALTERTDTEVRSDPVPDVSSLMT